MVRWYNQSMLMHICKALNVEKDARKVREETEVAFSGYWHMELRSEAEILKL